MTITRDGGNLCDHCGTENAPGSQGDLYKCLDAYGWGTLYYYAENKDNITVPGIGSVQLVDRHTDWVSDPYYDSDGRQGFEGNAWIVLKINGKFFRKWGDVDSFGEETWNGKFEAVRAVEQTTYTWNSVR